MTRPEARKVRRALKVDTRDWERQMAAEEDDDRQEWIVRPGVDRKGWERQLAAKGVTLVGGDVDEAPSVYRRLPDVLKAHAGTIEIVHQLKPFGVIMAGPGTRDPYKD
jgi:tRNA-splicing ligase RtcB (3'-phosphate/5'-hydroxy nucleic acid ligase)